MITKGWCYFTQLNLSAYNLAVNETEDLRLEALVDHFLRQGNFDHPDMEEVYRTGEDYGVSKIQAAEAFFVAREQAGLRESELLDGGDGSEAERTPRFGWNSIREMLFGKQPRE